MNNKVLFACFMIIITLILAGCDNSSESNDVTALPVVKKTSVNYSSEMFRKYFPDTISLININKAYSNNFSYGLKEKLLNKMKLEVSKLGEDLNLFNSILSKTYCLANDYYILPTYAEKAKYEDKDVWIFQVAYGLNEPVFNHFRCFVFSNNLDTLAFFQCK
jgi:hypothetical protein